MRAPLFSGRSQIGPLAGCALAALALVFGELSAWADIQQPPGAHGKGAQLKGAENLAVPIPQGASIDQGARVEITLRAEGPAGKMVDFLIRSQPEHGVLEGPPRQTGRGSAVVTYVHRATDGPGRDSFTYAVQVWHGAVSAAVPVSIEIRDTPPEVIATPQELDFGTVHAGDTSSVQVTLQNAGGSVAEGHLFVPPPWSVEGSPSYRLAHGESQVFQITFKPEDGRSYSETMHFAGNDAAGVHLIGAGIASPAQLAAAEAAARAAAARPAVPPAPSAIGPAPARASVASVIAASASVARGSNPNPARTSNPLFADSAAADAGSEPETPEAEPQDRSWYVTFADSGIKHLTLRNSTRSTLDISWQPASPIPASYRVELRYLTIDSTGQLRVDWRPYALTEIRPSPSLVTATVRGLPAGVEETLRVVASDSGGRITASSATLQAATLPPSELWTITPLRVAVLLFLICLALVIRRRLELRQILREIDESRSQSTNLLSRG
jgi:hypothetical protein